MGDLSKAVGRLRELVTFGAVGIAATVLYAVLTAVAISTLHIQPALGSVLAYGCAAALSYLGHKYLTFISTAKPSSEIQRFLFLTIIGIVLSTSLIQVGTVLGVPSLILIGTVSVSIPVINYVAMKLWVFRKQGREK